MPLLHGVVVGDKDLTVGHALVGLPDNGIRCGVIDFFSPIATDLDVTINIVIELLDFALVTMLF